MIYDPWQGKSRLMPKDEALAALCRGTIGNSAVNEDTAMDPAIIYGLFLLILIGAFT